MADQIDENVIPNEGQSQEEENWETIGGPKDPDEEVQEEPASEQDAATRELEKAKEEKAFFQTELQAAQDAMKGFDNNFYAGFQEERRAIRRGESSNEDPYEPPPQETEDAEEYMTRADLAKMKNDLLHAISSGQDVYRQQRVQEKFQEEWSQADNALSTLQSNLKVTNDVNQQVMAAAQRLVPDVKEPGGPSRFVEAYTMYLSRIMATQGVQDNTRTAVSEAEQKALQAKMVAQPDGSSAGMQQEKKLTREQKLLKQMQEVGVSDAKSEIFGT